MWVQEKVLSGALNIKKVPRHLNPADLLTHHCTGPELNERLRILHGEVRGMEEMSFLKSGRPRGGMLDRAPTSVAAYRASGQDVEFLLNPNRGHEAIYQGGGHPGGSLPINRRQVCDDGRLW